MHYGFGVNEPIFSVEDVLKYCQGQHFFKYEKAFNLHRLKVFLFLGIKGFVGNMIFFVPLHSQ